MLLKIHAVHASDEEFDFGTSRLPPAFCRFDAGFRVFFLTQSCIATGSSYFSV
jgi:hypothetical protein